jgi:hypothetical protein
LMVMEISSIAVSSPNRLVRACVSMGVKGITCYRKFILSNFDNC